TLQTGVGNAPMGAAGVAGELGAHLSDPVTEGDHVVEPSPGKGAEMLGRSSTDVHSPLSHDAYGIGMDRLGVASSATGLDLAAGELVKKGFGHLRARAVAGTEKEAPGSSISRAPRSFRMGG